MSTEDEAISPPRPNTIEAVAKAAGVSTMTVSRVLRETGNVSTGTQERVREAIARLGYVHNRLAGALASSRSTQIAVIVPSIQNIVFTDVLAGAAARLDGTGFQPVIGITEYDGARELELVRSMMAWRCAGIVLGHPTHLPETISILRAADFPVVELMALQQEPIDMCVGLDQYAAGRNMALHLLDKGYRRYAYLGTLHDLDTSAALRYQGFSETLSQHGAAMLAKRTTDKASGITLGRDFLPEVLTAAPEAELIYLSNDAVAAGAMMRCMKEGIDVPSQLALASFGGMELASALPVPITTTRSPRFTMGQLGADQIIRRIAGESVDNITDVGFELIPGASS